MFTGPNIVNNGLVLHLDVANVNSFRGEPTENLITNPLPTSTSGFSRSGGTGTVTYDTAVGAVKWEQTSYETWGTVFNFYPAFTGSLDTASEYTFSLEYKSENGFADSLVSHALVQGNGQSAATSNPDITTDTYGEVNGWKQYKVTFTPANSGIGSAYNRFSTGNRGADVLKMWFRNIQFEKKGYKTPFTVGTRGTTVATGGGWADMTGNSNHGELVNGPTFSSDNLGSLLFDGVDDYVNVNAITGLMTSYTQSITYEVWSYTPTGAQWHAVGSGGTGTNILSRGAYGGYNGLGRLSTDNVVAAYYRGSTSGIASATATISRDRWYHLVSIWNGARAELYVNGILKSTSSATLVGVPNTSFISIGRQRALGGNVGGWYQGLLNGVKIYNRALTPSEVFQNFNSTKSRYNL